MAFQPLARPREGALSSEGARASRKARPGRSAGAGQAGLPLFLQIDLGLHNSPPASGPGSRAEPLVAGRRARHAVSAMRADAYYRSPVNETNPVLVWTDGARLYFAPAGGQVTAGRMVEAPEPGFSPPQGYVADEMLWDHLRGDMVGGPLVVVARKAGAPDIEVAITNTLEQVYFTDNVAAEVSREGVEYTRDYATSVPVLGSGAPAEGAIHRETFADGFQRYRAPGGSHDLYVARGSGPVVHLVERATGDITRTFAAGTVAAITPGANGVVSLELQATGGPSAALSTVTIDLAASPATLTTSAGHATAEAGYPAARARLSALGVTFQENGLRMRVAELEMIEQALSVGGNRGLDALVAFRGMEGRTTTDPILDVTKNIGPSNAYGLASTGTPTLDIFEPFSESDTAREATVRHEMTHVIMGAIQAVNRSPMTAQERADLEGQMRYEAGRAREQAEAGLLRVGEYGAGERTPPAGTRSEWRSHVGEDPRLASLWVELLKRYSFLPDPEGTRELRGASLADESRYSGGSDRAGHPADSPGELVASFVTCATVYRARFVADVLSAEAAGNARGGGGGSYLRGLYRRVWALIDATYVPLGPSPL